MSTAVCVGCLVTGVRTYIMRSCGLLQPYQLLAGVRSEGVLDALCWECAALVNKFNGFRQKCQRAHVLLRNVYTRHQEISEDSIKCIDRSEHNLLSKYTIENVNKAEISSRSSQGGTKITIKKRTKNNNKTKLLHSKQVKFENVILHEQAKSLKYEVETLYPKLESDRIKEEFESALDATDECDDIKEPERKFPIEQIPRKIKNISKSAKKKICKIIEQYITPEEATEVYLQRQRPSHYRTAKFSCPFCFKMYSSSKACEKHQWKHDPGKGDYECEACKVRFATRLAIRKHITMQHMKKYTCTLCRKVLYTKEAARSHQKQHCGSTVLRRNKRTKKKRVRRRDTADDFNTVQVDLTQEQMMAVVLERQYTNSYLTARYKCTLCYKPFNEEQAFSNHLLQHDPVSGEFTCDICKLRYRTRYKLYNHISSNHMRKYSCMSCAHVCYNRVFARNHYKWHKGVVYTCHICGATSMKQSTHMTHIRNKHPSRHICGKCGVSFVSAKGLDHHTQRMHAVKVDTPASAQSDPAGPYCAECDIQFTSTQVWTKHILISPRHQIERRNIVNGCELCGETFSTATDLKRHHKTQHKRNKRPTPVRNDKQFPVECEQCKESMPSAGKYWDHFRTQHPGAPFPLTRSSFICEHCGKWFKHKSTLDFHADTHSAARQHQCAMCPKKFVKLMSLAAHAESHADGGQYLCAICTRTFAYKHSLTLHLRTHKVERPHVCWCGKSFAYDCNLKKHELTVHCAGVASSGSHV